MKKIFSFIIMLSLSLFILVGCGETTLPTEVTTTETPTEAVYPTIVGAVDKDVEFGSKFAYLEGITATDGAGVDITDKLTYEGKVDVNKLGSYQITYKVKNEMGYETSVTITITIIKTDKTAPLLTGVKDETIVLGGSFDPVKGVSANDAVDGDLTSSITYSGEVDTLKLGEYKVTYTVSDEAGNEVTKERTITIALGVFRFEEVLTDATVAGQFNVSEYGFCLLKLTLSATAEVSDASISVDGFTTKEKYDLVSGENVIYAVFYNPEGNKDSDIDLDGKVVTLPDGVTLVSYSVGVPSDITPPVFTSIYDESVVYLPIKNQGLYLSDEDILYYLKELFDPLAKDAHDNVYETLYLGGSYDSKVKDTVQTIKLSAKDQAGNVAELPIKVVFAEGVVMDSLNPTQIAYVSGAKRTDKDYSADTVIRSIEGISFAADSTEEGVYNIKMNDSSSFWYSAKFVYLFGSDLQDYSYYVISFSVKSTEQIRHCSFRMGQGIGVSPWYELFAGNFDDNKSSGYTITVTEEWTTYNFIIYTNYPYTQSKNYGTVLEWDFGSWNYEKISDTSLVQLKGVTITALSNTDKVTSPYTGESTVLEPVLFPVDDLEINDNAVLSYTLPSNAEKAYLLVQKGSVTLTDVKTVEIAKGFDVDSLNLPEGDYTLSVYYTVGDYTATASNKVHYIVEGQVVEMNDTITGAALETKLNINGRYSMDAENKLNLYYTASGFRATFTGTTLQAVFDTVDATQGSAYIVVLVDGELYPVGGSYLVLNKGNGATYTLASGLENKEHTVEVLKRSEASNNTIKVVSVSTDGSFGTSPEDRTLQILMIGASGSTGYGNLANSSGATQTTENSDGMRAFPYLVARMYDADITEVNASGWGAKWGWNSTTGSENIPAAFKKVAILPGNTISSTDFDFTTDKDYDLIMVNLGMNDINAYIYNLSGSAQTTAINAYKTELLAFYQFLHTKYPNAKILLIATSFTTTTLAYGNGYEGYLNLQLAKDNNLDYIYSCEIPANGSNGSAYGANSHANVKTHIESADAISAWIQENMADVFGAVKNENITFDSARDVL